MRKIQKRISIEYADYVYNNSIFSTEETFNNFLNKPKTKKIKK